jgi:hypothetical protein
MQGPDQALLTEAPESENGIKETDRARNGGRRRGWRPQRCPALRRAREFHADWLGRHRRSRGVLPLLEPDADDSAARRAIVRFSDLLERAMAVLEGAAALLLANLQAA